MDDEEVKKLMMHILENAAPEYLNPGPELLGKYLVCKDLQVISVFETEEEAHAFAQEYPPGSVEIRRTLETKEGSSTQVIIPGAIGKLDL
ncbi:MAG: hypothetical protein RIC89_12685 [Pseudomonadales bacterium]